MQSLQMISQKMQIQKMCAIEEIPADWEALDIGPKTAEIYA